MWEADLAIQSMAVLGTRCDRDQVKVCRPAHYDEVARVADRCSGVSGH